MSSPPPAARGHARPSRNRPSRTLRGAPRHSTPFPLATPSLGARTGVRGGEASGEAGQASPEPLRTNEALAAPFAACPRPATAGWAPGLPGAALPRGPGCLPSAVCVLGTRWARGRLTCERSPHVTASWHQRSHRDVNASPANSPPRRVSKKRQEAAAVLGPPARTPTDRVGPAPGTGGHFTPVPTATPAPGAARRA